jgi:hypothetical protein
MANIRITAHTPRGAFTGTLSSDNKLPLKHVTEVRDQLQSNNLNRLVLYGVAESGQVLEISLRSEILKESVLCFETLQD